MRKKLKIYLIASLLALSGCKDKCSDYDLPPPYGYLAIVYQNKNSNQLYFPANPLEYVLPEKLKRLKITDENSNDCIFSIPIKNNSYQIEIDSYLKVSGKIIDEKLYPKNFFIRFNDGSIDTLFTETIFQKNDCGYSNIKDFTAKYNQRAIKSSNNNLANNIEITIAK